MYHKESTADLKNKILATLNELKFRKTISKNAQKRVHSGSEVRNSIARRIHHKNQVQTYAKTPFILLKIVKIR